ncbi:hypothetical protein LX16_0100 [Stackebrandtia albiflava]|uniref:DUF2087 domain-containing protein n=1 Tax=Stackebrandtia albiflava TaxID=406432 RepID=A0A562VH38_9ACTN|nr:DUF2087 domain-containing protein [Stackebrandtia albiflava]TWJ17182.1 hypothetical protein LX16_0100 [Stackebrandtia albiflava]
MTPETLCGLLAEPERLRVFAAVVLGAGDVATVASGAGLPPARVVKAIGKLRDGGLIDGDDSGLTARPELFKTVMRAVGADRPTPVLDPDPKRNALLNTVLRDGRIRVMPEAAAKVRVVLEYVVTRFEPGVRYREPEVNRILRGFHDDHANLRRRLVDTGLMSRADGEYWRSGP